MGEVLRGKNRGETGGEKQRDGQENRGQGTGNTEETCATVDFCELHSDSADPEARERAKCKGQGQDLLQG